MADAGAEKSTEDRTPLSLLGVICLPQSLAGVIVLGLGFALVALVSATVLYGSQSGDVQEMHEYGWWGPPVAILAITLLLAGVPYLIVCAVRVPLVVMGTIKPRRPGPRSGMKLAAALVGAPVLFSLLGFVLGTLVHPLPQGGFEHNFKESFRREFATSCNVAAMKGGADPAEAATYCQCMADRVVENRDSDELSTLIPKLQAKPDSGVELAEELGCADAMQPVFKATFTREFVHTCIEGDESVRTYCECFARGIVTDRDAVAIIEMNNKLMEPGAASRMAEEFGCVVEQ